MTTPLSYARRLKLRMLRASVEHQGPSEYLKGYQSTSAVHLSTACASTDQQYIFSRRVRTALATCEEDRQPVISSPPASNRQGYGLQAQLFAAWGMLASGARPAVLASADGGSATLVDSQAALQTLRGGCNCVCSGEHGRQNKPPSEAFASIDTAERLQDALLSALRDEARAGVLSRTNSAVGL